MGRKGGHVFPVMLNDLRGEGRALQLGGRSQWPRPPPHLLFLFPQTSAKVSPATGTGCSQGFRNLLKVKPKGNSALPAN